MYSFRLVLRIPFSGLPPDAVPLVTSLGLPAVEEHLASCPAPQDWFLALPPPPLARSVSPPVLGTTTVSRRMSLTMQQVFSYSLPSSTKFTVKVTSQSWIMVLPLLLTRPC